MVIWSFLSSNLAQCSLESADVSCKVCGSPDDEEEEEEEDDDEDDEEETVAVEVIAGSGSDACTCPESRTLDSPQTNKGRDLRGGAEISLKL